MKEIEKEIKQQLNELFNCQFSIEKAKDGLKFNNNAQKERH